MPAAMLCCSAVSLLLVDLSKNNSSREGPRVSERGVEVPLTSPFFYVHIPDMSWVPNVQDWLNKGDEANTDTSQDVESSENLDKDEVWISSSVV